MHNSVLICAALIGVFLPVAGLFADEPVPLPADPSVPVVELWYVEGGQLRSPEITVFAGGRVQVRVGEGTLWGELSPEQVQDLVRKLLTCDQLAHLRTEGIDRELAVQSQRTGLSREIQGAADTIIRVRTALGTYRVDGHAVGLLCTRFPEAQGLQHLYSAQRRLENLRAIVMVGGVPAAERLARMAEARLLAESGEAIQVSKENLTCVHSLNDGTRCLQFVVPAPQGSQTAPRIVSLFESPGESPRVSVLPDESTIR